MIWTDISVQSFYLVFSKLWLLWLFSRFIQSCTECSPTMLLPNHCSSVAHQRFHQGSQPHVCPECGLTLKQPLFQKHLYEICLHFSRRVGYRYGLPVHVTSTFNHLLPLDRLFLRLPVLTDAPAAWWCLEVWTLWSRTSSRLIATCSTSAPAAPWLSNLPPAYRATLIPNIQISPRDRLCM